MPATDLIDKYKSLASDVRQLAVVTERFGNRTQAEQLRDDAALYERTAVWLSKTSFTQKLESEK